ncbi:MAG: sensor histidine kinase [Kurthia sp.]|nr:sensor histidine kinase [Candidatus Kurthia equi]
MEQQKNALSVRFQEQADEQIHWIHEIKTPLTAQRLMIDTMPPSKKKQELELEWLRIHLLLDQTLHTLRMSSLEQDLILQQVNLKNAVVDEIKALQSWFISQDMEIEIENLNIDVISDKKWLQIIIRQLLSNAIKYSPKGSSITIKGGIASNKHIYVEIIDHGQGIASQDIPRIFHRGFTGTIGRKQSASTGMGLYLVKNIADKLKINIQVDSILNEGTTIRLFFPMPNKIDIFQAK